MSRLLINESPLQVQPSLAKAIGLNEAIFLQQLHYWMGASRFVRDGRKWVYNSYQEWVDQLKYLSISTLKRAINSLKNQDLLIVEQFDKVRSNQINFYSINYENLAKLEAKIMQPIDFIHEVKMSQCIWSDCTNALGQDEPMDEVKMNQSPLGQNEPIYTRELQENTQESISAHTLEKSSKFSAKKYLIENGVSENTANEYLNLRNKKKKSVTETVIKLVLNQAKKANISNERAFLIIAAKGWDSFNSSWNWQEINAELDQLENNAVNNTETQPQVNQTPVINLPSKPKGFLGAAQ